MSGRTMSLAALFNSGASPHPPVSPSPPPPSIHLSLPFFSACHPCAPLGHTLWVASRQQPSRSSSPTSCPSRSPPPSTSPPPPRLSLPSLPSRLPRPLPPFPGPLLLPISPAECCVRSFHPQRCEMRFECGCWSAALLPPPT